MIDHNFNLKCKPNKLKFLSIPVWNCELELEMCGGILLLIHIHVFMIGVFSTNDKILWRWLLHYAKPYAAHKNW